eukprot:1835606-Amphidinium_carterae.1
MMPNKDRKKQERVETVPKMALKKARCGSSCPRPRFLSRRTERKYSLFSAPPPPLILRERVARQHRCSSNTIRTPRSRGQ